MNQMELLRLHMAALYTMDGEGRLLFVNEPWDGARPAPFLHVGVAVGKSALYCRRDLPEEIRRKAEALAGKNASPEAFLRLLGEYEDARRGNRDLPEGVRREAETPAERDAAEARVFETLAGNRLSLQEELCYAFPDSIPPSAGCREVTPDDVCAFDFSLFPWLIEELPFVQPCFACLEGNKIVSLCRSVRIFSQKGASPYAREAKEAEGASVPGVASSSAVCAAKPEAEASVPGMASSSPTAHEAKPKAGKASVPGMASPPAAHEAGIETAPAYRGKGYAKEALFAWAGAVVSMGAVPLYSTRKTNLPSRRLAEKAGLLFFASGFHIGEA